VVALLSGESAEERAAEIVEQGARAARSGEPFAWDPSRREELERRAAAGTSHVLYALSPGGVLATAERVERWRDEVELAVRPYGVDPDRLEALVFLESAGRPEVIAGETPEAASGLGQILPSTATDLLGMDVDLERSIALSRRIARAEAAGDADRAKRLRIERSRIDQRFDPGLALEGSARYLEIAGDRFGADDLATVSYHMGIGNLESVVRAYAEAEGEGSIGEVVAGDDLSYAQVFFDSAPDRNPEAHDLLSQFADDSSLYLWRVLAAEEIMRRWREDPEGLERTAELATAKGTLEEVYHPQGETALFGEPDDVEAAAEARRLLPVPSAEALGWVVDEQMGELAPELGREPALYRALRPEALATLAYMGARVAELSGARTPLRVTSTVRDVAYQDRLQRGNPEATDDYSLHTTGFSFDVLREYETDAQAEAFQFVLDRLRALAVIDYAVEPRAIHVTVSGLGAELIEP
jgi:hypothetical protein